jgi:hypothetical protein
MKDEETKSNMPSYMFAVVMLFIAWMVYDNVAILFLETGIPAPIVWTSYTIALLISVFVFRPIFMTLFKCMERDVQKTLDKMNERK